MILEKINRTGETLKRYCGKSPTYGVKTGLNAAFIIDNQKRDELLKKDPNSSKIIEPFLAGNQVKRWKCSPSASFLIVVPYGNQHELKNYPAVHEHLLSYEKPLRNRGQCTSSRNGSNEGQHHWLELDNNPSKEYFNEMRKPKLFYNETSKSLHSHYSKDGNLLNKTLFFIVHKDCQFLQAVLMSKVLDFKYRSEFPAHGNAWQGGRPQFRGNLMEKLPIPPATDAEKAELTTLAEKCAAAAAKDDQATLAIHEAEINQIVYRLFDLTPEEITLIESSLEI